MSQIQSNYAQLIDVNFLLQNISILLYN